VNFSKSTQQCIKLGVLFLLVPLEARAQGPLAAGRSAAFDASLGYAYVRMPVPGSGKIGMNGVDATVSADLLPRIGLRADLCYVRSQKVFGTGHHNDALTYMGGPVLYIVRQRGTTLYLHALFGGARLNGVNLSQNGGYLFGYVNKPAWSVGAGAERSLTPSVSLRIGADYVHTTFFDRTAAYQTEGSLRALVSVVYTFGRGHRR